MADAERGDTVVQVLKCGTGILQVFILRQNFLNLQLMRQLGFQVAVRSELVVGGFRVALEQLGGIIFFGIIPGVRLRSRRRTFGVLH
jgi:hypothetical protein